MPFLFNKLFEVVIKSLSFEKSLVCAIIPFVFNKPPVVINFFVFTKSLVVFNIPLVLVKSFIVDTTPLVFLKSFFVVI